MDLALVEWARRGDLAAFEEIVRSQAGRVLRLATAIMVEEADANDVAQEAFVAAWTKFQGLRDPAAFDSWMTRIVVNEARMALRATRRRRVREIPAAEAALRATGAALAAGPEQVDAQRLAQALGALEPDQRALLALHHLEGRGVAELATALGVPSGTVKSRLHTARRALFRAMDGHADDR